MAKLSDEKIKEIIELYDKLGVYAQVAKRLGVSASTVSKYVKLSKEEIKSETKEKIEFSSEIKNIKDIPKPQNHDEWTKLLIYSPEEWNEIEQLRAEI